MKCQICHIEKEDYHFFKYRNHFDKTFFRGIVPLVDAVCWQCASPYQCLGCGMVKDASEFRVGGRFCNTCKTTGTPLLQVLSGTKHMKGLR